MKPHKKRLTLLGGTLVALMSVAVAAFGISSAQFTGQSPTQTNNFILGTVGVSGSGDGISLTNAAPGDQGSKTFHLTSTGTLPEFITIDTLVVTDMPKDQWGHLPDYLNGKVAAGSQDINILGSGVWNAPQPVTLPQLESRYGTSFGDTMLANLPTGKYMFLSTQDSYPVFYDFLVGHNQLNGPDMTVNGKLAHNVFNLSDTKDITVTMAVDKAAGNDYQGKMASIYIFAHAVQVANNTDGSGNPISWNQ